MKAALDIGWEQVAAAVADLESAAGWFYAADRLDLFERFNGMADAIRREPVRDKKVNR